MRLTTILAILGNLGLAAFLLTNEDFSSPTKNKFSTTKETAPIAELWKVIKVSDGDTITVKKNEEQRKVRFCGIDAPEKKQPLGAESREFLENLISLNRNEVSITFVERDRYQRWIGEVFVNPGTNQEKFVNEEMIKNGHAWPYKQYWDNCPNKSAIAAAEEIANKTGKGIWLNPQNIQPEKWRRSNK